MRTVKYKALLLIPALLLVGALWVPLRTLTEQHRAASFPRRPIEMIVSFKEGGGTDIGARLLAGYLEGELGQPIIVRNVDGKDGELGFTELARARADGYTIGFINLPTFVSLPGRRQTRYRVEDITPIGNYVLDPAVLVVRSDSPWQTFEEWLEYCRRYPQDMTVSNNGVAASNHIAATYLQHEAAITLTHVPFGGTADMLRALGDGYVKASVAKISEVAESVDGSKLRVLASFTEERLGGFADVPTLKEYGFDIALGSARALAVPAGTNPRVIDALAEAFRHAIEDPEHRSEAAQRKLNLHYMDSAAVVRYMREQEKFLRETLPRIGI